MSKTPESIWVRIEPHGTGSCIVEPSDNPKLAEVVRDIFPDNYVRADTNLKARRALRKLARKMEITIGIIHSPGQRALMQSWVDEARADLSDKGEE